MPGKCCAVQYSFHVNTTLRIARCSSRQGALNIRMMKFAPPLPAHLNGSNNYRSAFGAARRCRAEVISASGAESRVVAHRESSQSTPHEISRERNEEPERQAESVIPVNRRR